MRNLILTILIFSFQLLCFADEEVRIESFDFTDGLYDLDLGWGLQDRSGYIWFPTYNGLIRYDGNRFVTFRPLRGGAGKIHQVAETSDGRILARSTKGNFIYSNGRLQPTAELCPPFIHSASYYRNLEEQIREFPEFEGTTVSALLEDRQGGIWIKTSRGLERVSFTKPKIGPSKKGKEKEEEIRVLAKDKKGRLWTSDKNGFVIIDNRLFLSPEGRLTERETAFNEQIHSFLADSKGNIWLGTRRNGILKLTEREDGIFGIERFRADSENSEGLSDGEIFSIAEDRRGGIWVATRKGGLNKIEKGADGRVKFLNYRSGFRNYPEGAMMLRSVKLSDDGKILIAGDAGLYVIDPELPVSEIKFYHSGSKTLSSEVITGIAIRGKEIWLSTSGGGLNRILSENLLSDDLQFENYGSDRGLGTDYFQSVYIDSKGRIWGIGKNLISIISNGRITNYSRGLLLDGFTFPAVYPLELQEGKMLVATSQGILTINNSDITKSNFVPPLVFENREDITLKDGRQSLRVEFAALDYNQNEPITYRYRLVGLDDDWHYTRDNHVEYANFPIGSYTLEVGSTNGDGVWVENTASIRITRHAAFYETWYFWMVLGLLAGCIIFGIVWTIRYISEVREKLKALGSRIKDLVSSNSDVSKETGIKDERTLFVERAKAYVESNIQNTEIDVSDFARYMNMSQSALFSACKRYLGYTPNLYIQTVRIKYAMKIMGESPQTNISDIAYRCGFVDPKYFSRAFKKITGQTPTEYRNQAHSEEEHA